MFFHRIYRRCLLASAVSVLAFSFSFAQESNTKQLPGDTSLPSTEAELSALANLERRKFNYSIEDFFAHDTQSQFRISRDGHYLSYLKKDTQGTQSLWLRDLNTQKERVLLPAIKEPFRAYSWLNSTQLFYIQDTGGDENTHFFVIDINNNKARNLTPFKGVKATLVSILQEDPDHVILSMNKDNLQFDEPYLLNTHTGILKKLYNNNAEQSIDGYYFDKDGNLRAYKRIIGKKTFFYYLIDGRFQQIKELAMGDTYAIIDFDYHQKNPDVAYVLSNLDSDKEEIQRVNLKTGEKLATIFANDTYDVSTLSLSKKHNYEIEFFVYEGERMMLVPASDTMKKVYSNLKAYFSEYGNAINISLLQKTIDEQLMLVSVYSDKIPGRIYLYKPISNELTLIHNSKANLNPEDMASVIPISFTSRDGLTIHGYFTRPAHASGKLPLIVNPHGGPQDIRNSWDFSPETQFFASRGYATLQVNFRISGGYGKAFSRAGYGQIGRKVMDDIEDGLHYVIEQGWVDKDRVVIYGASHGGYAVLRGLTKTPELYSCGIDYVGVSNLFTFMNTMPPYWQSFREEIEAIWYSPSDKEQQEIMREISPALHIDKITKPLFVIQGANDPRVNINEADQIVKALRQRGIDVPYMVRYDEGHGFRKEENKLRLYEVMMGFLSKCLAH